MIGARRMLLGGATFSPLSIPGLALWLKADTDTFQTVGGVAAVADADPVGQWKDQSGNANNATQATAGFRPTLRTAVQNGKPVIRADGVDDIMSLGTNVTSLTINGDLTMLAVIRKTTASVYGAFLSYLDAAGTNNSYECRYDNSNPAKLELVHADAVGAESFASTTTLTNNTWYVLEIVRSGTAISFFVNGSAAGTGTATKTPTSTASSNGTVCDRGTAPIPLPGDIAEIVLYNSALSAANRTKVEGYLNSRWGVY